MPEGILIFLLRPFTSSIRVRRSCSVDESAFLSEHGLGTAGDFSVFYLMTYAGDTLTDCLVFLGIDVSSVRSAMLRVKSDKEIRFYEVPEDAAPISLGRGSRESHSDSESEVISCARTDEDSLDSGKTTSLEEIFSFILPFLTRALTIFLGDMAVMVRWLICGGDDGVGRCRWQLVMLMEAVMGVVVVAAGKGRKMMRVAVVVAVVAMMIMMAVGDGVTVG
uniref:Uncharacterized protein n=1 Tax=Tanacetum cinerariifolium TaxID=118510 RepID=A0A6L2M7Q4_TANCI|nr:hypothetical protein [Tanacetum cinerariifolium]